MRTALLALLAVVAATLAGPPAFAGEGRGAQFQNLDSMIQALNLRPYFTSNVRVGRPVRIAVLDNGFAGAKEEIGRSLPANTQIMPATVAAPGPEEVHGFYMARILWSMLTLGGTDLRYAPAEFLLYPTYGYTNLKEAVTDVVKRKVDIVLYSQTWDYGGNFDGHGFINKLVDQALDAGVLWVNAAGNSGATTYNGGIVDGADDWVVLPGQNSSVEIRCLENPQKACKLRAVLSWNDWSDSIDDGTDKDLDLVLTDDTLNIVQPAALKQEKHPKDGEPGVSQYPREILETEIKPGHYFFRVKDRSKNFSSRDRLRLTVESDFVSMKNPDLSESVLPPADNPRVISVGVSDSDRSSSSRSLHKPELTAPSLVTLASGESFKGTSNSAAMVAAGIAILRSLNPALSRAQVLRQTGFPAPPAAIGGALLGLGLPLGALGFTATSQTGCFVPVDPKGAPAYIQRMLTKGGTLVRTNLGVKIFFSYDPIQILPGAVRQAPYDILVITATGPGVYPRQDITQLPAGMIEVLQTPRGSQVCTVSEPAQPAEGAIPPWTRVFHLP